MIDVYSHPNGDVSILVQKDCVESFKQLIQRATNTWDNAPPEIKSFADRAIHGGPLQDYHSQYAHKPLNVSTAEQFFEKQASTVEELAICSLCYGRGYNHLHNCPRLGKNG